MPPRVSVIMAVYNEEAFLATALESVLAQGFTDFEVIVSDDGSTDATPEIAHDYASRQPDRIQVLRAERNQGKAFALNRALAAHRGELIAWFDGDDVMLSSKLELQVGVLDANPDAAGCTHDAEMFDSGSGRVLGRFSSVFNGGPLRDGGVGLWFDPTYRMLPSATMIRSRCRPGHGFNEQLAFAHDWLFDIEVFRRGRCVAIDDVLTRYRRHGSNLSSMAQASGVSFEEGLMTMAIVTARYPELEGKARMVRTAILLGEARRRAAARELSVAARYGWAAWRGSGTAALLSVARHVADRRRRRARTEP